MAAAVRDALAAVRIAASSTKQKLLTSFLLVPAGIALLLAACWAVDYALARRAGISFPASVACLLLLFLALLLLEAVLGPARARRVVAAIDVPAGWSLRWISVFFTPAFVTLPLSPSISIVEVLKIIAVFVIGFFIMVVLAAYITRTLLLLLGASKKAQVQRAEELGDRTHDDGIPLAHVPTGSTSRATSVAERASSVTVAPSLLSPEDAHPVPTTTTTLPMPKGMSRATSVSETETEGNSAVSTPAPAPQEPLRSPPSLRIQSRHHAQSAASSHEPPLDAAIPAVPARQEPPRQTAPAPARAELWAVKLETHADLSLYAAALLLVGLPVYYATGYAMPLHLTTNVVAYMAALAVPPRWRQFLHPVLVSALLTVLTLWPLAEIRGEGLHTTLRQYKTGTNYLVLLEQPRGSHPLPGAGDVFSTVLDASIVALALPMFQYRKELRRHFVAIFVPNVLISIVSLFAYPPICYAIGISAQRSLAFASRSMTLALATPATKNLGGDLNTVSALAIVSGISGVLVGQRILSWLRIPEDDYITRGVTLGVNSSAIATALLLRTDPRAAALSTLSMSLFGTVTVLFTSIPPIVTIVRSLVGL